MDYPGKREIEKKHIVITRVTDDGKGNIWFGTDNLGIFIRYKNRNELTHIQRNVNKRFSLPTNHITCFYKDARDIMWIGMSKQGVAYSCLNNFIFENLYCPKKEDVSCLLEDKEGNLWFGFDGEGIARYDEKKKQYTYYNANDGTIPSNLTVCAYPDSKGGIWWGSFGDGAYYYKSGEIYPFHTFLKEKTRNIPLYIRRITEDKYGNIWFGTFTQGVFCLNRDGSIDSYNNTNSKIVTNYIADLSYVEGETMYIATSSGLYTINIDNREIVRLHKTQEGVDITHDDFVNCIHQDSEKRIWLGGRQGINIYHPVTGKIIHLSVRNGLSHNNIRAITEDKNKKIWVTTDHGITYIDPVSESGTDKIGFQCHSFFEKDGIDNFTFNNFSITCNKNNEILIGGSTGFLKINPNSHDLKAPNQKIRITGLYLANQLVDVDSPLPDGRILLQKNVQLLEEITVDYSDTSFALEFSAMDYVNLHKLEYLYRLGEKEEWIKLESNRLYFNKLSPGRHRLEIKVNDSYPHRNNLANTFIINVRPPFWLSFSAYVSYAVLFVLIVILILFKIRRKHYETLNRQRREMEIAQMHEMDEAKMRFFTNVSHDIRTPLSLIITPLEKLLATSGTSEFKEELEIMYRNTSILLNEVNQLLDFRKLDQIKMQLTPKYGNLAEFTRETCMAFQNLSLKNDINLDLCIDAGKLEMNFDHNKMRRILLNLLSNALKYNTPFGRILVKVDKIRSEKGEFVLIEISDTGVGIKDENKTLIFDRFYQENHQDAPFIGNGIGLHIVKEYVLMHGGEIRVRDNKPRGTVFSVMLPFKEQPSETLTMQEAESGRLERGLEPEIRVFPQVKEEILIVEDNEDFRKFLISCLKERYHVHAAADGIEALEVLSNAPVRIVISDVMMPRMDGMELCQRIKKEIRFSHIPVILLTARTAEEHIINGLKEGADEYVTKPFNLEILLLKIEKLLKWTLANHEKFAKMEVSPAEITVSSLDKQFIEKAIEAVEKNMDNSEFSVEDLSAYVGMSRGHLYKKLMLITGKSPIEFIRTLRIKRGRQLLEQTDYPISEIAYRIGLSPKLFAKYFREEYDCIPSKYQRNGNVTREIEM